MVDSSYTTARLVLGVICDRERIVAVVLLIKGKGLLRDGHLTSIGRDDLDRWYDHSGLHEYGPVSFPCHRQDIETTKRALSLENLPGVHRDVTSIQLL